MTYEIHNMDCRVAMSMLLAENSVDSIVTDPPYGLSKEPDAAEVLRHWLAGDDYTHDGNGFMGKSWDSFVPGPAVWREAYRVLKPGGYLLAFFGTRTYDIGVMAIRLAGFEIRDEIAWCYGSGFPKSLDVSKAIAKARTEDVAPMREVCRFIRSAMDDLGLTSSAVALLFGCHSRLVDHWAARDTDSQPNLPTFAQWDILADTLGLPERDDFERIAKLFARLADRKGTSGDDWANAPVIGEISGDPAGFGDHRFTGDRTIRTLDQRAADWQGWGTALKPAHEPIVVARKPLAERTVAANVQTWGTGGLNIDASRVEGESTERTNSAEMGYHGGNLAETYNTGSTLGRFPANLIHDGSDEVAACFPSSAGQLARASTSDTLRAGQNVYGVMTRGSGGSEPRADSGSAARFFKSCPLDDEDAQTQRLIYCAKASRSDRDEGLDGLPPRAAGMQSETSGQHITRRDEGYVVAPRANHHATVKPTSLMRYLVRLVTPPGGTVLDPFTGSGTTGKAALLEGFDFIGCELDADYVTIAEARCAHARSTLA